MTAGDDEMGMGLPERAETRACPEKSEIFWRLRRAFCDFGIFLGLFGFHENLP